MVTSCLLKSTARRWRIYFYQSIKVKYQLHWHKKIVVLILKPSNIMCIDIKEQAVVKKPYKSI